MLTTRRGFLRGIGALLAAPAIVRVASIMPVHSFVAPEGLTIEKLLQGQALVDAQQIEGAINPPLFMIGDAYVAAFARNVQLAASQRGR